MSVQPPVVLIIFNRPELTRQVFQAIRQAQPAQLFVIADGPRLDHPDDRALCTQARQITERVDWPCDVLRNYSAGNLGCGRRVASGLDWVFAQAEAAVILEDDTLPSASFFPFCQELLQRYRNDERVMYITGRNNLGRWSHGTASYFLSRQGSVWGWATWRRAWSLYDFRLEKFSDWDVEGILCRNFPDREFAARHGWRFRQCVGRELGTWDVQWGMVNMLYGGLCIVPTLNLVTNLGCHLEATHTRNPEDVRARVPTFSLPFPLVHLPGALEDHVDNRFVRWDELFALISEYRDVHTLYLFHRTLARNPGIRLPGVSAGVTYTLMPLRYPNEALQVLEYMQNYLSGNKELERLIDGFRRVAKLSAGER